MRCFQTGCKNKIPKLFKDLHLCSCKNYYCNEHKINHSCNINYFTKNKQNLEENMSDANFEKVVKC